jgi:outer membrane protein assembly factor BamB
MKSYPHLRRWLAGGIAGLVLLAATAVSLWVGRPDASWEAKAADNGKARAWILFGGSLQRNMVNTFETNVPTEWSTEEGSEKNILWTADLGSRSYAGPVIADGRLFIGTNRAAPRTPAIPGDKGVLRCYREKDGKLLWQQVNDKLLAGLVNDWPDQGICSTPMVDGNRLYYVTNRCELVCVDVEPLKDGKNLGITDEKYQGAKEGTDADVIWRLDMMKDLGVFPHNLATSCPLVVGDLVFVVTSNGVDEGHINVPAPKAPSFIAVDKKTGKVVWHDNSPSIKVVERNKDGEQLSLEELANRGQKILHGQWSNPVYAVVKGKPQIIFPGGDGWLRAFEPDPAKKEWKLIWKFDCNPKSAVWILQGKGTRNNIVATPVVHDNKIYVGVGQDPEHKYGVGHFWCVDITGTGDLSSELVVKYDPKLANDKVKKGPLHSGAVTKKNPNSGMVWHFGGPVKPVKEGDRNYALCRTVCTCAVHDGLAYIADLEGFFFCLDARTGEKYWEHALEDETWCSPYWVDGKIYIGNDSGRIFIFKHGKKKEEPTVIELNQGKIRATPVALNNVLYVMTENKLFAIGKK